MVKEKDPEHQSRIRGHEGKYKDPKTLEELRHKLNISKMYEHI